tara:strand:+ start:703 stop:1539 length:837 start_codon:yes stop_codon:yes gene_type:complete
MKVFNSEQECIHFARLATPKYHNLQEIITDSDFTNWNDILMREVDFEDFLIGKNAKLNLLITLIMVGLGISREISNPILNHSHKLLSKLNAYLDSLPSLKRDKNFNGKIKNLGGLNFLSTLSELSLADWLNDQGFQIQFETPFRQTISGKNRDIDLSATDGRGNVIHFEVYMPNKQFDSDGFFDPNEQDHILLRKIDKKLTNKFGTTDIEGLSGKVFIAINKIFFEIVHMKTVLPFFTNDQLFVNMANKLPNHVDGIFVFEDGFDRENSFKFEKLLIN